MPTHTDVVILGGGLAGLTLAAQILQSDPETNVLVLERGSHPPPGAAHKIGESTVELAGHYLRDTLGFGAHLESEQVRKFGTRFFFRSRSPSADLNDRVEVGGTTYLPVDSYQLDRGTFEKYLAEEVQRLGGRFLHSATVRSFTLGGAGDVHRIQFEHGGKLQEIRTRWVVDASGRRELIKRSKNLARPVKHQASSAWFRISEKLNIDDWSEAPGWIDGHERAEFSRWYSTNHLMGEGYWVWIIPLASDTTSIGIVADEKFHPLSNFSTLSRAIEWLEKHEPVCGEQVRKHQDQVLDFGAIRNFARDAEQVFSQDRWCVTGEAGIFIDPFYSPGSDFIAMANTLISDLIVRDRQGEPVAQRIRIYDDLFRGYCSHTVAVYHHQYELFGDPVVMPVKIIWDFALYWVFFAFVFCQGRFCDLLSLQAVRSELGRIASLNGAMQERFLAWHRSHPEPPPPGRIELPGIGFIRQLNSGLTASLSREEYRDKLKENIALLEEIAAEITAVADGEVPAEPLHMTEVWSHLGLSV